MSFTCKPLSGPHADQLDAIFNIKNSFYEFNPGKCVMPPYFSDIAQQILDAPVREDDVWLVSYPRTGSTWCQEMAWLIGNDLNFDVAKKTIQQLRAPMIELSTYFAEFEDFMSEYGNSVELVNNWPSPRYIKSHLPYELLPTMIDKIKPKIIYVARNPKDMCVSYYHHCKMCHRFNTTFEEFAELFLNDSVPIGSVWNHYLTFWKRRNEPNILFLKYEEMKKDSKAAVRKLADFLDKTLTDEQVDDVCNFLSVDNMRENPGCNMAPVLESHLGKDFFKRNGTTFIRKGQVGDWKNYMNEELSERFDKWIEDNTKGTGLSFD